MLNKKIIISLFGLTFMSLALTGCWKTKEITKQTHQQQTVKQIYWIKPVQIKKGYYNSNFKEVKQKYEKELWPFYAYINTYIYKKANKLFKNWDYFNILYNWKKKYVVYFDKNWNVTKLEKVIYKELPKTEYIKKLKNSDVYKKYKIFEDLLKGKNTKIKNEIVKKEIEEILKNIKKDIKDPKEVKRAFNNYLTSQLYLFKTQIQNLWYIEKEKIVKNKDKDFIKVLKYIYSQVNEKQTKTEKK